MLSPDNIISPPASSKAGKKAPRTVHIDVYCTGSDAEEDSSDASSSSSAPSISHDQRTKEDDSISTPQTVYDTNQFRLQHKRIDSHQDLPRRLGANLAAPNNAKANRVTSPTNLREFLLSKSDTKDEVNESKQMLFNKHVGGDSGNSIPFRHGRFTGRNRFRKDTSDDCLSSNYPNSSRSTVRDFTCSSISSALASNSAINDGYESSWKETDIDASVYQSSIAPSESFEYDNTRDRQRIRLMNERWGQGHVWNFTDGERRWQQSTLDNFEEEDTRTFANEPYEHVYNSPFPVQTFTQSIVPARAHAPSIPAPAPMVPAPVAPPTAPTAVHFIPTHAEARNEENDTYAHRLVLQRSMSNAPPSNNLTEDNYEKQRRIVFNPIRSSCSQSSSIVSRISGYTMEHLMKARRFGQVVPAIRKPGHHVGPAKNPDCQCDHCRRWFAQREGCRERALSLGDTPFSNFWPGRHPE